MATDENKPKKRGGARPGAGRKPKYKKPMERYDVLLDEHSVSILTRYGDENLSEGIRRAAQLAEEAMS